MVNVRPLCSELARKAANELNENPENIDFGLSALRDWLQTQPQLCARTTDQFLIAFLRGSKFSLEKAKQKLENFYTYRALLPELYEQRVLSEPKIEAIMRAGSTFFLPEPVAVDGPLVVFVRPSHFNMDAHSILDVMKVAAMMVDILLEENDNAIIAGYIFIMDLGRIPKAVLLNFDPELIKKLTVLANKAAPTRMKSFHFLNVLPIFEKLFSMVKSVISSKLKERFYVHGSTYEGLYAHVPRHILPKEYGGQCDINSVQEQWWQKLNMYADYLQEEAQYGLVREHITCGKFDSAAEEVFCFGTEGSFRQLDFD